MNSSAWLQKLKVAVQKHWIGKALAGCGFIWLRVGKGYPDLIHFILGKTMLYKINTRADKCNIGHFLIQSFFSSHPDPVALYINTNKILFCVIFCKANCILASSTAKFKHNWIIVLKLFCSPFSF